MLKEQQDFKKKKIRNREDGEGIRQILKGERDDMFEFINDYLEELIKKEVGKVYFDMQDTFIQVTEMWSTVIRTNDEITEKIAKLEQVKTDIDKIHADILVHYEELPEYTQKYIDKYVDNSIKQVISQGMKCSTKISHKEENLEEKVLIAQGKIKRALPIIKERMQMIEDRLSKLESVSNDDHS